MMKPTPAFYCCYLLRSTVRHQATYVGSTPNPVRRLKQHNGEARGGAVRTSRLSLRPWEMTCIVSGFPSRVAALQFEWAWQNTHLTRHIPTGDRITAARTTSRVSPRTGRVRKRLTRPCMPLTDRLSNLHLLLRVKSFDRWPLRLTFFNEEVHRTWEKWLTQTPFRLRDGIIVQLEKHDTPKAFQRPEAEITLVDKSDWIGKGLGIHGIDIGYAPMKAYLDKSIKALKRPEPMDCTICKTQMSPAKSLLLVCPTQGCKMVSHITCLSRKFLDEEGKAAAIVPLQGKCPSCQETLQWSTLMRDLSLRSRGEQEVAKLFRKGKSRDVEEEEDEDTEQDLSDGFAEVDDWCDPEDSDKSASKQSKAKSSTMARVEKTKDRPKTKKAAKSTSQKDGPSDDSWADAEVLD